MENAQQAQSEEKVNIRCFRSTRIPTSFSQNIEWTSDTRFSYMSAYEFSTYSVDDQCFSMINRERREDSVLCMKFLANEMYSNGVQVYYVIQESGTFYLCRKPSLIQYKRSINSSGENAIEAVLDLIIKSHLNLAVCLVKRKGSMCLLSMCLITNISQIFEFKESIEVIFDLPGNLICILSAKTIYLVNFKQDIIDLATLSEAPRFPGKPFLTNIYDDHFVIFASQHPSEPKTQLRMIQIKNGATLQVVKKDQLPFLMEINCEPASLHLNRNVILAWKPECPLIEQYDIVTEKMKDRSLYKKNPLEEHGGTQLVKNVPIDIFMGNAVVKDVLLSPKNSHLVILTKTQKQEYCFLMFQFDLYEQVPSIDHNIYIKAVHNLYRRERIDAICRTKVNESVYMMSKKEIHTIENVILNSVVDFDVHPLGYYLAATFGITTKIYAIESGRLNLIYTYSASDLKKVRYNPNGADLALLSGQCIQIMDAYSFAIKYIIQEKHSIDRISYSNSGKEFYVENTNGYIDCYLTHCYKKLNTFQAYASADDFGKVVTLKVNQKVNHYIVLFTSGTIMIKKKNFSVELNAQVFFQYDDGERITAIEIEDGRGVLFLGTSSGNIRCHMYVEQDDSYHFGSYTEVKVSDVPISAIALSMISPKVFVGDSTGNLSLLDYSIQKVREDYEQKNQSRKINFYNAEIRGVSKAYKYLLCSDSASSDCPQRNKLQYKLSDVIGKLNGQVRKFKDIYTQAIKQKTKEINYCKELEDLYRDFKEKIDDVTSKRQSIQNKMMYEKAELKLDYETQLREILNVKTELSNLKGQTLSQFSKEKAKIRKEDNEEYEAYRKEIEEQINDLRDIELEIEIEQNIPIQEFQTLPLLDTDVKKQLMNSLQAELLHEKALCYELRKDYVYMLTSQSNLESRKTEQEALVFKIENEIKEMKKVGERQRELQKNILNKTCQTENIIHKVQENATKLNCQFGKRQGSDECNYKAWMKEKLENEVDILSEHLIWLEDQIDESTGQLVELLNKNRINGEKVDSLNNTLAQQKVRFTSLKNERLAAISRNKDFLHNITFDPNVSPDSGKCVPQFKKKQFKNRKRKEASKDQTEKNGENQGKENSGGENKEKKKRQSKRKSKNMDKKGNQQTKEIKNDENTYIGPSNSSPDNFSARKTAQVSFRNLASERLSVRHYSNQNLKGKDSKESIIRNIDCFQSMLDRQHKFMKVELKVGHRKVRNFSKEHSDILNEYTQLKYENKDLISLQRSKKFHIENLDGLSECESKKSIPSGNQRRRKMMTSFQNYLKAKEHKASQSISRFEQ